MVTAGGPDAHVSYVGSDIFIAVSTLQCAMHSIAHLVEMMFVLEH